jgi:hypothetical protein
MKKLISSLIAAVALTGCMTAPQTAQEMRQAVASGTPMSSGDSYMVSRSYSATRKSVLAGVDRCLTTTQSMGIMTGGPMGMRGMHQIGAFYRPYVSTKGGRTEIAIHKQVSGAMVIGSNGTNALIAYVVDIAPGSGGTRIDTYGGSMGYGELNGAIRRWASGGAILPCPTMP